MYVHYDGVLELNEATMAAFAGGNTDYGDHYFRTSPRFKTGNERYRWLNTVLFVGRGQAAFQTPSSMRFIASLEAAMRPNHGALNAGPRRSVRIPIGSFRRSWEASACQRSRHRRLILRRANRMVLTRRLAAAIGR